LALATSLPAPVVTAPPVRTAVSVDVSVEPREEGALKRAARRVPSAMGHVPLLRRLPGLRRDRDEPVVAARPSEDLSPRLPADVSRKLTEEVEVDVDASIDEEGAVKNAEIVRGDDPQLSALAANAVRAAHWTPARSGDRSVPMNVVVHYRFSPGREP
jgi:TonB family protein